MRKSQSSRQRTVQEHQKYPAHRPRHVAKEAAVAVGKVHRLVDASNQTACHQASNQPWLSCATLLQQTWKLQVSRWFAGPRERNMFLPAVGAWQSCWLRRRNSSQLGQAGGVLEQKPGLRRQESCKPKENGHKHELSQPGRPHALPAFLCPRSQPRPIPRARRICSTSAHKTTKCPTSPTPSWGNPPIAPQTNQKNKKKHVRPPPGGNSAGVGLPPKPSQGPGTLLGLPEGARRRPQRAKKSATSHILHLLNLWGF